MPKASAGDPRARKRFRIEPKVICTVRTTIRAVPVGESNSAIAVMHLHNAQPALRFSPLLELLYTAEGLAANKLYSKSCGEGLDGEFDPGSGRTLAACLTHASRTRSIRWQHR